MRNAKKSFYYYIFHTQYGYLGLSASEKGLRAVVLPNKNKVVVKKKLLSMSVDTETILIENKSKLNSYYRQICDYFRGISKTFCVQLDLRGYSDFSQSVWRVTQRIPYGETRSYSWIAEKIRKFCSPDSFVGNSRDCSLLSRAVGNALGKNPIPIIIPCHRVLKKDGSLGGFSAGLGWKRLLLNFEKQNIKK